MIFNYILLKLGKFHDHQRSCKEIINFSSIDKLSRAHLEVSNVS